MDFLAHAEASRLMDQLDYFTCFLTLVIVCIIPTFITKKGIMAGSSALDYFLMGRKLSLPLFVATMVATWYGGIFGVTKISFEQGIYNFVCQGIFWYAAYLIFALVLVDRIFLQKKATSLADLLQSLYGKRAKKICAIFNFLDVVPVVYIVSLGLLCETLFNGSAYLWMLGWSLVLAVYSAFQGFRGLVIRDLFQLVAMLIAIFSVPIFSFVTIGSPLVLIEKLPPTHFDPLGGETLWQTLVWGFIALSTLSDPNFYQRCLACSNPRIAKCGLLIAISIWFFIDCATTLSGLYARVAIAEANPNQAYLLFSLQLLPSGMRGIFIAGIVATIITTLDSYLFTGGQALMRDLFAMKTPNWHRIGVFITAAVGCLIAYHFDANIKEVWKFFGSLSSAAILLPVILTLILGLKISESTFLLSCILSAFSVTGARFLIPKDHFFAIDPFYLGSFVSLFVCFSAQIFPRLMKYSPAKNSHANPLAIEPIP